MGSYAYTSLRKRARADPITPHDVSVYVDPPSTFLSESIVCTQLVNTNLKRIQPVELGRGFTHYIRYKEYVILFKRTDTGAIAHICVSDLEFTKECVTFIESHYKDFLRQLLRLRHQHMCPTLVIQGEGDFSYPPSLVWKVFK